MCIAGLPEPVLEDILALKDFLLRHTEILRGRGAIASTATGVALPLILYSYSSRLCIVAGLIYYMHIIQQNKLT